jgi:hypothetical protein
MPSDLVRTGRRAVSVGFRGSRTIPERTAGIATRQWVVDNENGVYQPDVLGSEALRPVTGSRGENEVEET